MERCFKILRLPPPFVFNANQFETVWKILTHKTELSCSVVSSRFTKKTRIHNLCEQNIGSFFFCMQNLRSCTYLKECALFVQSLCAPHSYASTGTLFKPCDFSSYEGWAACQTKWKAPFDDEIKPSSPLPFRWARRTRRFTLSESDAAWMVLKSHSSSRKLWNLDRCDSVKLFFKIMIYSADKT